MKEKLVRVIGLGMVVMIGGLMVVGWSVNQVEQSFWEHKLDKSLLALNIFKIWSSGIPILREWDKLTDGKRYIVLLQNNTELRATGGFMGSYVKVAIDAKGLDNYIVRDIYQPDGQLPGHVEPPYPVQEAFLQGWWRLRDSNWDVDFASAAATIAWFFEQGGEAPVDGIVTVDLDFMKEWIGVMGGVKLTTYFDVVTADNFANLAQKYAEYNYEPGSTQKRDFLGAVGVALWEKTKSATWWQKKALADLLWSKLQERQIQIWFKDKEVQAEADKMDWTGRLKRSDNEDFLYLVESNLGSNKANCCVERKIDQSVEESGGKRVVDLKIDWINSNPASKSNPPWFWGGDYGDYVRIVIPGEYRIDKVDVGGRELRKAEALDFLVPNSLRSSVSDQIYNIEERGSLQIVGFWAEVRAKEGLEVNVKYSGESSKWGKNLMVRRQFGVLEIPYSLSINGRIIRRETLTQDKVFNLE